MTQLCFKNFDILTITLVIYFSIKRLLILDSTFNIVLSSIRHA